MAEQENSPVRSARSFDRAKRHLLLACGAIGVGLAVAGTVSQTAGGALVLGGAAGAIFAIHRLGRAGVDRDALAADAKK